MKSKRSSRFSCLACPLLVENCPVLLPRTCLPAIALAQARQAGNNGMVEYWNVDFNPPECFGGLREDYAFIIVFDLPVKKDFTITHFSILPEPRIPSFHYSNIPIAKRS
jgi:hypothetical protein